MTLLLWNPGEILSLFYGNELEAPVSVMLSFTGKYPVIISWQA
jgi:hypothetical protein